MTLSDIAGYRLINQQIAETRFKRPDEIVSWLVAMQAQDFAMAKWAIGLRLPETVDAEIEKAFNSGTILRTHLMRPTWHFITPLDIRWMLKLTAPRVNAFNAFMYRQLELDSKVFKRSNDVFAKALQGGNFFTRAELNAILERAKINANGLRLGYLFMRAELDGIICSGPRKGKQFTYALLEERALVARTMSNDESLAELARRYITSRGPATVKDFAWWSGLTIKDAKAGFSAVKNHFKIEMIDGEEYIFTEPMLKNKHLSKAIKGQKDLPAFLRKKGLQTTFLLPDYDEYGISYKNRTSIFPLKNTNSKSEPAKPISYHMIIVNGVIAGTWQRTVKKDVVDIVTSLFLPLSNAKQQTFVKAIKRYRSFVNNDLRKSK